MTRFAMLVMIAVTAGSVLPAHAQPRARSFVTRLSVDAIGTRSTASIRTALRSHDDELSTCRAVDEALVSIALSIAPDGSVLRPVAREDPDLDPVATGCVLRAMASWHFPRGRGVTSVSLAFWLRGSAEPEPAPPARTCWCFGWVHLGDHGTDCTTTRRACERGRTQRESSGDSTECETRSLPACVREGWIHGQHMVQP